MVRSKKEKKATRYIEGISVGEIKRWRNLSGTWKSLGYDTKEAFDAAGVSDLRMVQHIKDKKGRNEAAKEAWAEEQARAVELYKKDEAAFRKEVESNKADYEQKVADKVAKYLEDFEAPTESDEDNLKNLVEAQLRLEDIHRDRRRQMAQPFAVKVSKTSRDVFSDLADEEKGLLQQIRLSQKGMGIDRPTREDKAAEVTGVDRVQAIVQEAKEFLANEIVEINHCGVRVAWYARFFPEEPLFIRTKCPRCGEEIVYGDEGA